MAKLFGTDGVRGLANSELTPEIAYNLGRSGAFVLSDFLKRKSKILIGKDTRISGDLLEAALVAGICSVGADVDLVGVIPTPGIAYLTKKNNYDAGIMISASHNPFYDNGIKFFNKNGYKLSDELENKIEEMIFEKNKDLPKVTHEKIGFVNYRYNLLDDYADFLENSFGYLDLSNFKIALDCANGATYKIASRIFKDLGAKVYIINNNPDGININLNCGSTHIDGLVKFVFENNCDIGFAFDGDGDRCLIVDGNGKIIYGDEILSIIGCYMKSKKILQENTIVTTIMSNLGLFMIGKKEKINIIKTKVGDRYIAEEMIKNKYNLGGEQSGHIILSDYNTTGDGILTALYISKIMFEVGEKICDLNNMEVMPQVLVNAKVSNVKKNDYLSNIEIKNAIKSLENKFGEAGRVIIRPSGTEPVIRVMLEGQNKNLLNQAALNLANLIEKKLK